MRTRERNRLANKLTKLLVEAITLREKILRLDYHIYYKVDERTMGHPNHEKYVDKVKELEGLEALQDALHARLEGYGVSLKRSTFSRP